MRPDPALIDAIFASYGISAAWRPLPSTGLANHVYATADVVLRLATEHPEAVSDARTESVAAPAARAAGILTPRLIAFDDTRAIADRPYSLWERVHGEPLGALCLGPAGAAAAWNSVGAELARLHLLVRECADPNGYLDEPSREHDLEPVLTRLVEAGRLDVGSARNIERFAAELRPLLDGGAEPRFLHHDVHAMNVMCSEGGALRALIDFGDAGWGDPALEFAAIPLPVMDWAVARYVEEAPGLLGDLPEARFAWDKLLGALEDLMDRPDPVFAPEVLLDALRDLVRGNGRRFAPTPR